MLILIAESKTMAPCNRIVSNEELSLHAPAFGDMANMIMNDIAKIHRHKPDSLSIFTPDGIRFSS